LSLKLFFSQLNSSEKFDEGGWKQVAGSVFLPPKNRYFFCAFTGTGVQLFFVLVTVLICCLLGFSHPRFRGKLVSVGILLFVVFGFIAGYVSSRLFKLFIYPDSIINPHKKPPSWIMNIIYTNIFFPLIVFTVLIGINLFLAYEGSSAALDVKVLFILLVLWVFCSSPMTIVGGFVGIKQKDVVLPVKINKVPLTVPSQPFYLSTKILWIFTGAIPFA
jgi:transmembrane 9 superfamily protein 2/4